MKKVFLQKSGKVISRPPGISPVRDLLPANSTELKQPAPDFRRLRGYPPLPVVDPTRAYHKFRRQWKKKPRFPRLRRPSPVLPFALIRASRRKLGLPFLRTPFIYPDFSSQPVALALSSVEPFPSQTFLPSFLVSRVKLVRRALRRSYRRWKRQSRKVYRKKKKLLKRLSRKCCLKRAKCRSRSQLKEIYRRQTRGFSLPARALFFPAATSPVFSDGPADKMFEELEADSASRVVSAFEYAELPRPIVASRRRTSASLFDAKIFLSPLPAHPRPLWKSGKKRAKRLLFYRARRYKRRSFRRLPFFWSKRCRPLKMLLPPPKPKNPRRFYYFHPWDSFTISSLSNIRNVRSALSRKRRYRYSSFYLSKKGLSLFNRCNLFSNKASLQTAFSLFIGTRATSPRYLSSKPSYYFARRRRLVRLHPYYAPLYSLRRRRWHSHRTYNGRPIPHPPVPKKELLRRNGINYRRHLRRKMWYRRIPWCFTGRYKHKFMTPKELAAYCLRRTEDPCYRSLTWPDPMFRELRITGGRPNFLGYRRPSRVQKNVLAYVFGWKQFRAPLTLSAPFFSRDKDSIEKPYRSWRLTSNWKPLHDPSLKVSRQRVLSSSAQVFSAHPARDFSSAPGFHLINQGDTGLAYQLELQAFLRRSKGSRLELLHQETLNSLDLCTYQVEKPKVRFPGLARRKNTFDRAVRGFYQKLELPRFRRRSYSFGLLRAQRPPCAPCNFLIKKNLSKVLKRRTLFLFKRSLYFSRRERSLFNNLSSKADRLVLSAARDSRAAFIKKRFLSAPMNLFHRTTSFRHDKKIKTVTRSHSVLAEDLLVRSLRQRLYTKKYLSFYASPTSRKLPREQWLPLWIQKKKARRALRVKNIRSRHPRKVTKKSRPRLGFWACSSFNLSTLSPRRRPLRNEQFISPLSKILASRRVTRGRWALSGFTFGGHRDHCWSSAKPPWYSCLRFLRPPGARRHPAHRSLLKEAAYAPSRFFPRAVQKSSRLAPILFNQRGQFAAAAKAYVPVQSKIWGSWGDFKVKKTSFLTAHTPRAFRETLSFLIRGRAKILPYGLVETCRLIKNLYWNLRFHFNLFPRETPRSEKAREAAARLNFAYLEVLARSTKKTARVCAPLKLRKVLQPYRVIFSSLKKKAAVRWLRVFFPCKHNFYLEDPEVYAGVALKSLSVLRAHPSRKEHHGFQTRKLSSLLEQRMRRLLSVPKKKNSARIETMLSSCSRFTALSTSTSETFISLPVPCKMSFFLRPFSTKAGGTSIQALSTVFYKRAQLQRRRAANEALGSPSPFDSAAAHLTVKRRSAAKLLSGDAPVAGEAFAGSPIFGRLRSKSVRNLHYLQRTQNLSPFRRPVILNPSAAAKAGLLSSFYHRKAHVNITRKVFSSAFENYQNKRRVSCWTRARLRLRTNLPRFLPKLDSHVLFLDQTSRPPRPDDDVPALEASVPTLLKNYCRVPGTPPAPFLFRKVILPDRSSRRRLFVAPLTRRQKQFFCSLRLECLSTSVQRTKTHFSIIQEPAGEPSQRHTVNELQKLEECTTRRRFAFSERRHELWSDLTLRWMKKERILKHWLKEVKIEHRWERWECLPYSLFKTTRSRLRKLTWREPDIRFQRADLRSAFKFYPSERNNALWLESMIYRRALYSTHRGRYQRYQVPREQKRLSWLQRYRKVFFNRDRSKIYLRGRRWPRMRLYNHRLHLSLFKLRNKRVAQKHFKKLSKLTTKTTGFSRSLEGLGNRLDVNLILLNIAPTVFWARILATKGVLRVNSRIIYDPSYLLKPGDIIQWEWKKIQWFRFNFKAYFRKHKSQDRFNLPSAGFPSNFFYHSILNLAVYDRLPVPGDLPKNSRLRQTLFDAFRLGVGVGK